jgi:hypothetical protein
MARRPWTWAAAFTVVVLLVAVTAAAAAVKKRLLVDMTLVPDAASTGAGKYSSPSIRPLLLQPPPHCPAQLLFLSLTCVRDGPRQPCSVPRREPAGVPPPPRLRRRRPRLAAPVRGRRLVQHSAVVRREGRHAPRLHQPHDQARGLLRRAQQRSRHEPRCLPQLNCCSSSFISVSNTIQNSSARRFTHPFFISLFSSCLARQFVDDR